MSKVFDKVELLEELDGDPEFLEEALEMMDSDAPALLKQIYESLENHDTDTISGIAHTIKSMVGNFCASPAYEAALNLETVGRSGDLVACSAGLVSLEEEVSRLQRELHKLLDEIK
ncbi:MAG: Hpt domain-containing protein [Pirellulales bacterium]